MNVISQAERDLAKIVFTVRQLCEGRSNAVGTFTLAANVASTTVTAQNCGAGSSVLCFPATAGAAAEWKNGTMYIGTVSNGSFVVSHANSTQTDRTYMYVALG
ncbi:MAG TPA: hypothetical protein VH678_20535 [Xanthobacteraceae bacterium]|jgi:hypothetical protein